ncbi:MAG: c-type cytochrome [Chloroflexi bacterium]|nr:c-type cytochrome [Chloroflexota bacterium]MBP7044409.1 c-type cytochrome [Chloroflexota bacterium]
MNYNKLISFLALLVLIVALPVYAWQEPTRMDAAQADLRQEFVSDAAVIYVENCSVCHGAAGEGIGPMPALDNLALQTADYDDLFKTIARGRYNTAMVGWHVEEGGSLNDYQIEELVTLIRYADWSQVGELAAQRGLIPATLPVPDVDESLLAEITALAPEGSQWAAGLQLYASNCTLCHGVNGEGTNLAVPLNTADIQATDLAELERIIREGVPGTLMVSWNSSLAPEEITSLAEFLQNWDELSAHDLVLTPPEPIHIDVNNPEEMLALGERIYNATCVVCHGVDGSGGTGPVLNSQQILSRDTDEMLTTFIINGGRMPNANMPPFGDRLTSVEIEAVVQFLRAWEPTAPSVQNPRGTAQGGGPPWLRATPDATNPVDPGTAQSQGQGKGGPPWRDTGVTPGGATPGQGQTDAANATMPTAVPYSGQVVAVADNLLTFQTADGVQLDAMLGPPWFWSESGIALAPGDQIELEGFESTDATHMEVNWLTNLTTGETIQLRTPEGLPVWNENN